MVTNQAVNPNTNCQSAVVSENLKKIFRSQGFEVVNLKEKIREGRVELGTVFKIDTYTEGEFEVSVTSGDSTEVIIRAISNYGTNGISQSLRLLRERTGISISPIFLRGEKEVYPFPTLGDPTDPSTLPPEAIRMTAAEGNNYIYSIDPRSVDYLVNWPSIGARGLRTKYGIINGFLLSCDGSVAIFDTPEGLIRLPVSELLDPFGKSYGESDKKAGHSEQESQVSEPDLAQAEVPCTN